MQSILEVRDVMIKRASNIFRISLLASCLISLMWTQSFLPASLQGTISSRGARHMDSPMDEFNSRMSSHGFVQDDNTTRDPHGKGDILGKGQAGYILSCLFIKNFSPCLSYILHVCIKYYVERDCTAKVDFYYSQ